MNLSPEIIKMREALLERIGDKSLKEVAQIVNEILLNETDSTNRLAALAARVKVLRNYINKNYDIKNKSKNSEQNNIKENAQPTKEATSNVDKNEDEKWVRVEMLKSGVVNGVRFPEGVVIDVNKNDADKLEESKLAKIIEATETKEEEKVEAKEEPTEEENSKIDDITKVDNLDGKPDKKIIKTKSTKITEETIELTDPKAVAEALGLNDKKKKEEEPKEIEEEIDIEAIETGKKK
jgi:hypothetical protein